MWERPQERENQIQLYHFEWIIERNLSNVCDAYVCVCVYYSNITVHDEYLIAWVKDTHTHTACIEKSVFFYVSCTSNILHNIWSSNTDSPILHLAPARTLYFWCWLLALHINAKVCLDVKSFQGRMVNDVVIFVAVCKWYLMGVFYTASSIIDPRLQLK